MLEKMREVIAEQLEDCDPDEITMESRFKEDLDIDSLDLYEMVMKLEEEYEIEVPTDKMEQMTTVGSVVEYLESLGIDE